jgi:hypothetical protein
MMKHPFITPEHIESIDLGKLLIPREDDPGHRGMRPKAAMASYQVSKAFLKLKPQLTAVDTIITEHCSETFQEDPKPIGHCPAQTSAKGSGHWLMERGRPLTVEECARIQRYIPEELLWNDLQADNYFMLGNTMSVNIVQRLLVAALRAIGIHCQDPWAGRAQAQLIASAKQDRLDHKTYTTNATAAQEARDHPPPLEPVCPPNEARIIKNAIRDIKAKIAKHNKRTTYSPNELHVMQERLFDLEVCLIHENSGGKIKHKYADLSKFFKSDFDPNILPKMPKIATRQTIPPHNPVANSQIYKPLSDGDDSSVRSDGFYSELDQL